MRKTFATLALVTWALTACKQDGTPMGAPASTIDQDMLWALAPAGARGGVVASGKAIGMVEDGLAMLRSAVDKAPELLLVKMQVDGLIEQVAGSPQATLADLGLSRQKGAAIFAAKDGEMLAIVPVVDRDKFLGKVGGTKGATATDPDVIGDITCRSVRNVYACAKPAALLDTLGKGALKSHVMKLGTRGDIEMVGAELAIGGGKGTLVQVLQLARGGGTLRGTLVGLAPELAKRLASQSRPRPESARSASFAVFDLRSLLAGAATTEMFGPELAAVIAAFAGAVTVTVPAGEHGIDARIPLSDGAPGKHLVEQCTSLPGIGPVATLKDGVCHFPIPNANLEVDLWLDADGKTLRLGTKDLKPGLSIPLSNVGREIASGAWSLAFWGRGTVMGASQVPGVPGSVDPQTAVVLRALSAVNELGLGLRVTGDKLEYVATLRTIFANPDPVIAKLLAVTPDDIAAARAGDKAKVIATEHAGSPFAQDFKAGQMGLAIPYMMLGTFAGIAVPAFMESMKEPAPAPSIAE